MPSGDRRRTLAGRLTKTMSISAMVSAALAILAGMLLADALITARVEGSVAAAARVMQVEVDEAPEVADHIEGEAHTLGVDGRVAIVEAGRVLHGDPGLAGQATAACRVSDDSGLVCGAALRSRPGAMVLVAAPLERLHGHRRALLLAALIVLLVVAAAARVVGGMLARRSLVSLHHLRDAVADADVSSPTTIDLPPPAGLEELDALRSALDGLMGRLNEELGRARRFAASAAHELRTPLATMRAELELAIEGPSGEAEHEYTMTRLARMTARLETLTQRLLMLATPHDALVTDQCTSMAQLVEELPMGRFATEARRLRLDVCETDALVRGDEHLLSAMLDNLVDNALKFSEGPVRVAVRVDASEIVVDVQDDGLGVPPSLDLELFEPFHRGVDAGQRPGHGLGLALVRHIARACGGRVAFVRDGLPGTTVRVQLPVPDRPSSMSPCANL